MHYAHTLTCVSKPLVWSCDFSGCGLNWTNSLLSVNSAFLSSDQFYSIIIMMLLQAYWYVYVRILHMQVIAIKIIII